MKKNLFLATVIIVLAAAGYLVFLKPGSKPSLKNTVSQNNGQCGLIRNATFQSVKQYEGGMTPQGSGMRYWTIKFQPGESGQPTFHWDYSDIATAGTYMCNTKMLQAEFSGHSLTAKYDSSREVLTWDGVEYKKIK